MTIRLDPLVLQQIRTTLRGVEQTVGDLLNSTQASSGRVLGTITFQIHRRTEALRQAEGKLESCLNAGEGSCSAEAQAVRLAMRRRDAALAAKRLAVTAAAEFATAARAEQRGMRSVITGADRQLNRKLEELSGIAARPGPAGAVPESGRSGSGLVPGVGAGSNNRSGGTYIPAGFPSGFAMIPVSMIDQSFNPITGARDFTKGYTVEDLDAAFELFESEVLPALARNADPGDFAVRDAQLGRMGVRSLDDTYRGFLGDGSDAIRLSPGPDGYQIDNGRHRVWVAAQTGRTHVPAKLLGGGP
jgi:hypothetical protein